MDNISLQYLAGFTDGEGCIQIMRRHKERREDYGLRITITNTNLTILQYYLENFGGKIHENKKQLERNWALSYEWYLDGANAAQAIKCLLPFLIIKQKQAQIALKFQKTMHKTHNRHISVSAEEFILRRQCYLEMRELNKRGFRPLQITLDKLHQAERNNKNTTITETNKTA